MFEFWCEYDINPIIIFNQKGNIIYCNQEAEIFLSYINKKEVFDFVIKNAPLNKGIKTEFKKIIFKDFEFNGYSIGYEDDNKIGVRFFINTEIHNYEFDLLEKVDISMLIDFAIEATILKQNTKFTTYFDPSIPEIYLNKKELLNNIFEIFENQKEITIKTKIKIGEYIKHNNKKYPILEIIVKTTPKKVIKSKHFEIINNENGYIIELPIIKERDENSNT